MDKGEGPASCSVARILFVVDGPIQPGTSSYLISEQEARMALYCASLCEDVAESPTTEKFIYPMPSGHESALLYGLTAVPNVKWCPNARAE